MSTLLTLQNVTFKRGHKPVLDDVSFKVEQGSFTTIIGPNGAGKSTLVQIMLGGLSPEKGRVIWADMPRIGYIPQKVQLDAALPIQVGTLFNLKPGCVMGEQRHQIERLTDVRHLQSHFIADLSGGELQRVLLAYALLGDPAVLVMDEPMQGLDIDSEAQFLSILQALKYDYGKTIIMVSHDLHVVFKHSDHVICLQGHLCCQGQPSTVQVDPAYLNLFGRKQLELMAIYRHHHDHHHHCQNECDHG